MKNLLKALAKFQSEVPTIHENTKGFNYTYSDLNTIFKVIKPLLSKHGLGFTQPLDGDKVKTIVYHVDSGESIESSINIPTGVSLKGQNDYQTLGSGITYLRRYSLSCVLGLITDKDADAHGEQVTAPKKKVLTDKQFDVLCSDKAVLANIVTALKMYDMTEAQRKVLTLKKADLEKS
jgi:hypothetical protein